MYISPQYATLITTTPQVWVSVDAACVMHYDVMLAGPHEGQPHPGPEPLWNLTLREQVRGLGEVGGLRKS